MHETSEIISLSTFLSALLLLLLAAKIGGEIAERCGQPSVLGEILAGVVVGVTGFGWIVPSLDANQVVRLMGSTGNAAAGTFAALDALAELGVVLLLFEIGLHCDLVELRRVGKSALWVGAAGVILPFVGGYVVAHYAFQMPTFTALFIGAALTATSVGITARVFQDLKLLHTKESAIVLGAAVADDVIGLVILAVISALGATQSASAATSASTSGASSVWIQALVITLTAVGFLVGAVWLGVKSVPLIDRSLNGTRSRGATTVIAFAFCLLMALLGQKAGLAPIIGAFAGGLVLSHSKAHREIQDAIKPLADLLIPLFFALMGASINLRTLGQGSQLWLVGGALIVVAVLGKVLGCATVPDKSVDRVVIGLAMIPRGEVGLIYARLGSQNGWLSGVSYDALILMVMATTLVTPPLLRWAAGRKGNVVVAIRPNDLEREDWELFEVEDMLPQDDVSEASLHRTVQLAPRLEAENTAARTS